MEFDPSWHRMLEDRDLVAAIEARTSTFKFANGKHVPIRWTFKDKYIDEYTQEELPAVHIQDVIIDELP